MLTATVDFGDTGLSRNLNFARFELVLQSRLSQRTMLAFTPWVGLTVLWTQETLIASACNVANVTDRQVLDQNRWVFKPDWIVNAKLTVFICTHCIQIVIVRNEACMTVAASDKPDWYVVAAEFGKSVHLVASQSDAETKLAMVVGTPRKHLRVLIVFCLYV